MTFKERVMSALAPVVQSSGDLDIYIGSLSDPTFQEVEDYASDGPADQPGWSVLVDLNRIPDKGLDWLGQFVGIQLDAGISAAQKRQQISQVSGWKRGSVAAIAGAPLPYLTGTKTVIIRERDATASPTQPAYGLTVITKASETPPADFATTNLHTNPSYEVNAGGVSNEANLTINGVVNSQGTGAVRPIDGVGALSVMTTAGSSGSSSMTLFRQDGSRIPVTAGLVYTWSVHTWMAAFYAPGRNVRLWILWYDSGGSPIGSTLSGTYTPISATAATRISFTATAPAGAASARTGWELQGSVTANEVYLVDAIQFEQNPVATPFTTTSRPIGQGPVGKALLAQKPAGIILNYVILAGQDYSQVYNGGATTYQNIFTTYTTYQGLLNGVPGT